MRESEQPSFFERPATIRGFVIALVVVGAAFLFGDFFYDKHTHYEVEGAFGFYAFVGFGSYLGLIFVAKALRRVLRRSEDYYE